MRVPIHAKIHGLPKNAYKTVALASALFDEQTCGEQAYSGVNGWRNDEGVYRLCYHAQHNDAVGLE
ncbi:hypothetical protein [Brevibacillus parabrevis]|uniref:hypothetical protein n=1 Tax=Brevibacillus parabrevis TaxID=54914 RepID=UPI002E22B47F|nr:hypothetical protein [Brevibacillus parabrevis]